MIVYIVILTCDLKYRRNRRNNWKYLQIRDCITKGQFMQDKNPAMELLDLPWIAHRAAVFYKAFKKYRQTLGNI